MKKSAPLKEVTSIFIDFKFCILGLEKFQAQSLSLKIGAGS